jgi:hypothetical protein
MANLSSSSPSIPVFVRNEFLYNQEKGSGQLTAGWLVGVRTVKGLAVTFYVLLENGVLFTGLPIHSLCHKKNAVKMELPDLEMWDSLSYDHSIFQLEFLKKMSATVLLKNKTTAPGEYTFSIDFSNQSGLTGISESPNEWKVFHFIKLENGNFALYPQNRILFKDAALTKFQNPKTIDYKVNQTEWTSETGDKWTVGDDVNYFYGMNSFEDKNGTA